MFDDQSQNLPSTPMTGPTPAPRRLESQQADMPVEDSYVIPARPSTLRMDAEPDRRVLVQLARRRLNPPSGFRRL